MFSPYPCPTCGDRYLKISELPSCASPRTIVVYLLKLFLTSCLKNRQLRDWCSIRTRCQWKNVKLPIMINTLMERLMLPKIIMEVFVPSMVNACCWLIIMLQVVNNVCRVKSMEKLISLLWLSTKLSTLQEKLNQTTVFACCLSPYFSVDYSAAVSYAYQTTVH